MVGSMNGRASQECALAQVEWNTDCDRIRTELPWEKAVAGQAKLKRLKQ
jgi:hypothetical protein